MGAGFPVIPAFNLNSEVTPCRQESRGRGQGGGEGKEGGGRREEGGEEAGRVECEGGPWRGKQMARRAKHVWERERQEAVSGPSCSVAVACA